MFVIPLRDINLFGIFVTPAAALLPVCLAILAVYHWSTSRVDLNRYIWNRPLFEVALFAIVYALALLTLR